MTHTSSHISINNFKYLSKVSKLRRGDLRQIIQSFFAHKNLTINYLDLNFLNQDEMLRLNIQHLKHAYHTDIITFDLSQDKQSIIADMYINVEMLLYNAAKYEQSPDRELQRLLIHGCLHLAGYQDKTPSQKKEMTRLEDFYLSAYNLCST